MAGPTVIIDGIRWRVEDAEARGLIGERTVPAKDAAPEAAPKAARSRSPRKAANKAAEPESK